MSVSMFIPLVPSSPWNCTVRLSTRMILSSAGMSSSNRICTKSVMADRQISDSAMWINVEDLASLSWSMLFTTSRRQRSTFFLMYLLVTILCFRLLGTTDLNADNEERDDSAEYGTAGVHEVARAGGDLIATDDLDVVRSLANPSTGLRISDAGAAVDRLPKGSPCSFYICPAVNSSKRQSDPGNIVEPTSVSR